MSIFLFILSLINNDKPKMDIDEWYRKYGESVYRRALRFTRDESKAMDIMQETFLKVIKYQNSFRGDSSPLTWLFTIVDRCFFDSIRPNKNEIINTDDIETFVKSEMENHDEIFLQQELVSKLLINSKKDVRQIVVHRYFDELNYKQIAEKLNINEKTVRRKIKKFLESAKKYLRR